VATALAQGLFPVAVSVSILLPAAISAALGKYVHKVSEIALVKVPVPLEVQSTPAVLVALAPAVMFTAPLVAQVVIDVPATAEAGFVSVNVLVSTTFEQPALAVAVKVRVTVPAVMSAALGVYVQVVKEVAFVKVPVPLRVQVTPA
jgi:hypothetical protein